MRCVKPYLVLAYTLGDEQQFAESDKLFQIAAAGGDPDQRARSWDGMAYVRIQAARQNRDLKEQNRLLGQAESDLREADKALPRYDSAWFHEAEVAEILAEDAIGDLGCNAQAKFNEAARKFERVTSLKPDFAIAYYESGVMWLNFFNYVQNINAQHCEGVAPAEPSNVAKKANDDFEMALRYDIDFKGTWLQWSILTFQQAQIENDPDAKTALFDLAIERNTRAIDFVSRDFYPVRRLFDAIKGLTDWQEELRKRGSDKLANDTEKYIGLADVAEEYRLAGIKVFCQAFPGQSWTRKERQYLTDQALCEGQSAGRSGPRAGLGG
jgi:hypothetical protein